MAKKTVEQIDAQIARWQTRLKRAVNTIEKLRRERKRADARETKAALLKEMKPEPLAVRIIKELAAEPQPSPPVSPPPAPAPTTPEIDTSIPAFLKRSQDTFVEGPIGRDIADEIRREQANLKKRKSAGRIAKMKAKQSGETRRMPLTGKAALAAIRGA